jgi:hypothetical protein
MPASARTAIRRQDVSVCGVRPSNSETGRQARAVMVSQMLALVLVASSVSCSRDSDATQETHGPAPARDWVFVYYLSCDNDLSTNTPLVLKALRAGVGTGEVAVAALVDDADRSGMVRFVITGNGSTEEKLPTEDSASIRAGWTVSWSDFSMVGVLRRRDNRSSVSSTRMRPTTTYSVGLTRFVATTGFPPPRAIPSRSGSAAN